MSIVISSVAFNPINIPDHLLLTWEMSITEYKTIDKVFTDINNVGLSSQKYELNNKPENFLTDMDIQDSIIGKRNINQ